jgi:hypothetical protein
MQKNGGRNTDLQLELQTDTGKFSNCTTNYNDLFNCVVREQEAMKGHFLNLTDISTIYRCVCEESVN